MKYLITIPALIFLFVAASGQYLPAKKGIHFEESLMWPEILEKAKKENKYIFVHCTATWCVPCKEMEIKVYVLDSISEFFNVNFIAVKVQMDSTEQDKPFTKDWYSDAVHIKEKHLVTSFPTYLFFTPSGDIVYKEVGFRKPPEFMTMVREAVNPNLPYLTLLKDYKTGKVNDSTLRKLVTHTEWLEPALATQMAHEYTIRLLQSGNPTWIYDKENVRLMAVHTKTRKDPAYHIFFRNGEKVDSVMQEEGFARSVLDMVITNEFITPQVTSGSALPDWKKIEQEIAKHYNKDFAERNVLWARALWYSRRGDKRQFVNYAVEKINKYGVTHNWYGDLLLNHVGWNVFLYSSDQKQIRSALKWMDGVTQRISGGNKANVMDTYANLLYKANKKEEAIAVQKKVVALAPDRKEFRETLHKMQKGLPTWQVE